MNWDELRRAFHHDGSLRDIYVLDASTELWEAFLDFVRCSGLGLRYTRDGEVARLPPRAAQILADRSCAHTLEMDVGGVVVCCHFFVPEEIELDIDPRAVVSPSVANNLLAFIAGIGARLSRDVILTEENSPGQIWLRYSSQERAVRYVPGDQRRVIGE